MEVLLIDISQFRLSYLKDPRLKSRTSNSDVDPFDSENLDPQLYVSPIAPKHSLVLNKYPSISKHVGCFLPEDLLNYLI
jgi:ATP adenylyltransferase/5',5'''-P-1,P-4-tetraphosphate phosphorylase II